MMVDKEFIAYFKLAHGFFNTSMLALFCVQAWMGFQIRQARQAGAPMQVGRVRFHRKAGPLFAFWGVLGYAVGITVILLDKGRVFLFPMHFLAGTAIVLCIAAVYTVSRTIRGTDPGPRNRHFILGSLLLLLYVLQVFLGLGILF